MRLTNELVLDIFKYYGARFTYLDVGNLVLLQLYKGKARNTHLSP
jgi:hypothetical protein